MFTIHTRFTSFLYLPISMISMISMITRSDMQRERARERIDRARRQWELEHGKLAQPLPFHLAGIITIKSRWQLLAFPAGSNIPERKPYFNQTMTNVGELEAVVENEKGRKSAAGSSQMMPPYDAAVLTMVRSTFISTIIIQYDHIAHISKTGRPQRKQCLAHLLDRAIGRAPATLILLPTIRIRSPILQHL